MDKYKRYYGLIIFLIVTAASIYGAYNMIQPKLLELEDTNSKLQQKEQERDNKQREKMTVVNKMKKMENSRATVQKKIYSPVESDLGNDSLFFTLYNDVIEIIHSNSVKIKSINYTYNPKGDEFVQSGKDYFVCDINVELVSNYTNLGKLIQDLYQYPYYIRINSLNVKPYAKDKKILLSDLSIRLYAYTEPREEAPTSANGTAELPGI